MLLSPLEIQQKQFRLRFFKGLDPKEVEAFLQKVADQLSGLLKEIDELKQEMGEKEISSSVVGERVMNKLHELDDVAYVRFASVYREFKDVNDFVSELKTLLSNQKTDDR